MKNSKLTLIALAASTVILAGCGGGGSTTSTASTTPATTTTPSSAATINSVVATPTYAAGSQQAMVYSLLNAARVSCGFGSVSENTDLDTAAQAHANWMLLNNIESHDESSSYPNGYTGVTPQDRDVAAGYVFTTAPGLVVGEVLNGVGQVAVSGESLLNNLLAAPYHLTTSTDGFVNLGIGYVDSNAAGTTSTYGSITYLNIDMGVPSGSSQQNFGPSDVLTYPCQGTTGTALEVTAEDPNPVPSRDLSTSPIGQSITVKVLYGQTLALTSATMINMTTGADVALLPPVDSANDSNGELLSNQGFVMPNAPLTANTAYEVTVNGTNNGTEFSRTFTFTTGTGT